MRRRGSRVVLAITITLAAACSHGSSVTSGPSTGSPTANCDKLAQIQARGTLVLPVDPAYPPASFAVEGVTRRAGTACASNQLTAAEVDGYDVATGKRVAEKIGVEPCFVTPTWVQLLSGHWGDRWDIAFSSIGITTERMKDLYFTRPYYATPERFYVGTRSSAQTIEDLDRRRIGVCAGCFADLYLQKRLDIPGETVEYRVDDAVIVPYAVERGGLEDVSTGKLDAFLCQETAGNQAINEGLPLRAIDPAPYAAFPAGAVDRSSGLEVRSFVDRVNGILASALQDGSLGRLSKQYFGTDYASQAASFDIDALHQTVE